MSQHLKKIKFESLRYGYFWRKEHHFLWLKDKDYVARHLGQSAFDADIEIPGEEYVLAYDNDAFQAEDLPIIIAWTGNPAPNY